MIYITIHMYSKICARIVSHVLKTYFFVFNFITCSSLDIRSKFFGVFAGKMAKVNRKKKNYTKEELLQLDKIVKYTFSSL